MTIPEVQGYFKNRDDMLPFVGEILNEKILEFLRAESKYIEMAVDQEEESSESEAVKDEESTENQEKSGE
jgi:trigger factor